MTQLRFLYSMVAIPPGDMHASGDTERLVRDPIYQQLNELLQKLIHEGEFKRGQQFLTEREVSERFGVSRVTANKALSHLVVEGVLEFRKGVGSFVREGVNERLYYFERLRLADGVPVILERRHLVVRFCPGLTKLLVKGFLYRLLTEKYALAITSAEQRIQAVNLSAADARQLKVPTGAAALRVLAIGHAEAPLWVEDTLYRGDRYEFHNALGPSRCPRPANLVIAGQLHQPAKTKP